MTKTLKVGSYGSYKKQLSPYAKVSRIRPQNCYTRPDNFCNAYHPRMTYDNLLSNPKVEYNKTLVLMKK